MPKAESKTPRARSGETADRILEATREIIAQEGVDALRLSNISVRLGISPPAIYAHFPGGRQQLVREVALAGVRRMQQFFQISGQGPEKDLLGGIAEVVQFYAKNRAFLRILLLDFSMPAGHPSVSNEIGPPGPFAQGAFSKMYGRLDGIIRLLIKHKGARDVSTGALLNIIIGTTALNLIHPPEPASADTVAQSVDEIVRDVVCRYLEIDRLKLPR